MKDVHEYIRDVLIMYSSLQSFQPKPNPRAHTPYRQFKRNMAHFLCALLAGCSLILSMQGLHQAMFIIRLGRCVGAC